MLREEDFTGPDAVGQGWIFSLPPPNFLTFCFRSTAPNTVALMKVRGVFGLKARGSCTLKHRHKLERESMRCSR